MKTLIFNGSPRNNGDTISLINEVVKELDGEYKIVNSYDGKISPCIDCRFCWKNDGCSIKDGMQEVYEYIQECDNVLIASPLHFAELSGPLLSITSRLQTYFCKQFFRKEKPVEKPKKGAVILVGGGFGDISIPYRTAKTILHHMNCKNILPLVSSHKTNTVNAIYDEKAIEGIKGIVKFFNNEE